MTRRDVFSRLVIPLRESYCAMIALAANAQSKEEQVPMSVAHFESEYAVAKTELEYSQGSYPFPVAIE
jgi:hypothetical protein